MREQDFPEVLQAKVKPANGVGEWTRIRLSYFGKDMWPLVRVEGLENSDVVIISLTYRLRRGKKKKL